jgi:hypothetical protein
MFDDRPLSSLRAGEEPLMLCNILVHAVFDDPFINMFYNVAFVNSEL